jgi:hypothetical protein
MALGNLLGFASVGDKLEPDLIGIIILALLFTISFVWKKIKKKKPSAITMILISAVLGVLFYSVF